HPPPDPLDERASREAVERLARQAARPEPGGNDAERGRGHGHGNPREMAGSQAIITPRILRGGRPLSKAAAPPRVTLPLPDSRQRDRRTARRSDQSRASSARRILSSRTPVLAHFRRRILPSGVPPTTSAVGRLRNRATPSPVRILVTPCADGCCPGDGANDGSGARALPICVWGRYRPPQTGTVCGSWPITRTSRD